MRQISLNLLIFSYKGNFLDSSALLSPGVSNNLRSREQAAASREKLITENQIWVHIS